MRILRHEDCPMHEECRSGEHRLYPRHGNADTTGTAGHAHTEALTAAHGSQDPCQDPQAEDQYDTKAAMTHACTPASSSLVGVSFVRVTPLPHKLTSAEHSFHIVAC